MFSLPVATKMFQFTTYTFVWLWIHHTMTEVNLCRVSPFGYPRLVSCMHFPVAFRSFLRPSSAPGAKAFSLCSYSLDLFRSASKKQNIYAWFVISFLCLYLVFKVRYYYLLLMIWEYFLRRFSPPMEAKGFEPPTPCVQGRCSPS